MTGLDEVVAFEHKVTTAYYWPVDTFAERLGQAGFTEIERGRRPGVAAPGYRQKLTRPDEPAELVR